MLDEIITITLRLIALNVAAAAAGHGKAGA